MLFRWLVARWEEDAGVEERIQEITPIYIYLGKYVTIGIIMFFCVFDYMHLILALSQLLNNLEICGILKNITLLFIHSTYKYTLAT